MGVVVRARQVALDRRVVLKLLALDGDLPATTRERFSAEARILAGMHHQNVLAVLDHGFEGPVAYLVYPDEGGLSLKDWVATTCPGGRVPVPDLVLILDATLAGLEHVHARGVVHRDLKPGNLLVAADGSIRVFDFGLALDLAAPRRLTDTSRTVGTPAYMAPDQVRGTGVDPRDDLYSLGVVAYELASGTNPFLRPELVATLQAHLDHEPPPLDAAVPGFPVAVAELVASLLAKRREDRPADAARARKLLATGRPGSPRPRGRATLVVPATAPASPPRPRTHPFRPVAAALLLAGALGAGILLAPAPPGPDAPPPPAPAPWKDPAFAERLRAAAQRLGPELSARGPDPAAWPGLVRRLPGLAEFSAWVADGGLAREGLDPGLQTTLVGLDRELAALGLADVFGALVEPVPADEPVSLSSWLRPGPEAELLAERRVSGWLASASRYGRLALDTWLEDERLLRETPRDDEGHRLPFELSKLLGSRTLGFEVARAGGPDGAAWLLSTSWKEREGRIAAARWMARGNALLRRMLVCLGMTLHREPATRDLAAVLGWQMLGYVRAHHYGRSMYMEPRLLLAGPPEVPASALLLGVLLRAQAELHPDDHDPERSPEGPLVAASAAPPAGDRAAELRAAIATRLLAQVRAAPRAR